MNLFCMKKEELERKLKSFVLKNFQQLDFRLRGEKLQLLEIVRFDFWVKGEDFQLGETYEFVADVEVFVPEANGQRDLFLNCDGNLKIDENGEVAADKLIFCRIHH